MQFPAYQNAINLIANLLISRCARVFMYVLMREHRAVVSYIVLLNNVYNSNTII
jgi:hypothetical protein